MPDVKPYAPPRISHLPFIAFTKHFTPTVSAAADARSSGGSESRSGVAPCSAPSTNASADG